MKLVVSALLFLVGSTFSYAQEASNMQPFEPGDIFIGATVLDNPDDDHAGKGRIVQFDANLNQKGVLWTEGTTHLITGTNFAPDGSLWAFDPWSRTTIKVDPSGKQSEAPIFKNRSHSKAHFIGDKILVTEQLVGTGQPLGLSTRFPTLEGEDEKLGDGDLYLYTQDGTLVDRMDVSTHGGMSGGMGVTHSVLSKDQSVLFYVSETGPRLMAYNLLKQAQMPDLKAYPENTGNMFFDLDRRPTGNLLVAMGNRLDEFKEDGTELGSYSLEGFGWSVVAASHDDAHVYVANWFSGEVVKYNLDSKQVVARTKLGEKTIAGIAEYWPKK